ncbi:hypothetical protein [Cyanobium sp. LEGE 06113]|uniref:hypothetical protein n=1 Tax=Cyanobium sp. LEGE 06113 TaxID=1297573 RepID=UPI00187FFF1D|nr:hypothetical protein [Cyanobium sp. LEGE 06113]MBE9153608.1 hypothetical protein [Cyanobium sp. LEGE 06113]
MASSPSAAFLRLRQTTARRILASAWWAGFTFNGITADDDGHDSLIGGDELSDGGTWPKAIVAEPRRDELLELCWERLDAFRGHRHAAGPVLRPHGEGRVAPRRARIQIGSRRQSRMA